MTLIFILIAAIANFHFTYSKIKVWQPRDFNPYSCMLWFIWISVILLTLLLGATWAIAMLMVNVFALDTDTFQWTFLGVSSGLVRAIDCSYNKLYR